ncbi:NDR1/HIN1-like protein 10 [Typha latifolia]|uniref:NDR1/HIN1-like protein 10 n=1 Tax=Typha latifolia TaxID=4733 RepID=UPI003C2B8745
MYQTQQNQLPGGYYGPPIPPQAYSQPNNYYYENQERRTCLGCLVSTILKAFIAFWVVVGILILILWLVYRPHEVKVGVESATLTSFNLTSTNPPNLSFNLSASVSIRNPNDRIGIYYDWLEADSYYRGERFDWLALPTFYQGHKNTTTLVAAIEGQSYIGLGTKEVADFGNDNKTGWFDVDVWLYGRVRYKFGSTVTRRYTLKAKCPLSVQLVGAGGGNSGFGRTKCDIVSF